MSSSEDSADKVRLIVKADTDATEIFIIDGKFRRVGKGLGTLETRLPPGLYDVKFKAGSVINEVPVALERGQNEVRVEAPKMEFSSPAPLSATRANPMYHRDTALRLSEKVHQAVGDGSEIFVFTRDLETFGPADTMTGLTLHDISGQVLVDFSAKGRRGHKIGTSQNPWAGCTVGVNPGIYRLRVRISDMESLEQTIVASQGWQTQLFLTVDDYIPGAPCRYPDLTNASIFMARPGAGFNPDSQELRWTELARQGLVNRRNVVLQRDLNEMLWAKYENPIFGIYAAHLALLSPEPDISLLKTVTSNLYFLVGDHPDVRALAIYLAGRTGKMADFLAYEAPPMLRSSWDIVVNATALKPDLVPLASLSAKVSERLWGNSPWLIWLSKGEMPINPLKMIELSQSVVELSTTQMKLSHAMMKAVRVSPRVELTAARDVALSIGKVAADRSELQKLVERAGLTPIEQDLLGYMIDVVRPGVPSDAMAKLLSAPGSSLRRKQPSSTDERLTPGGVVRSLGVPAAVASAALEGLVNKLGLSPGA